MGTINQDVPSKGRWTGFSPETTGKAPSLIEAAAGRGAQQGCTGGNGVRRGVEWWPSCFREEPPPAGQRSRPCLPRERKGHLPVRVPSLPRALPFPPKGGLFIHRHTVHPTLNENLAVKTQLVKRDRRGIEHPPRVGVPVQGRGLVGRKPEAELRGHLPWRPARPDVTFLHPGIHNVRPPDWTTQARFVFPRILPCSAGSCCSNLA